MTSVGDHWEDVYATKSSNVVSWYQRLPSISLRLIESVAPADAAVIDIGGGASLLIDHLLDKRFMDLTVLDVSQAALDEVRNRLGNRSGSVSFVRHDVLTWTPTRSYDVWHDRAVFHFLTDAADRQRYIDLAQETLRPGGMAIVGAFAEDGPTHCSGLPVCRYSPEALDSAFFPAFVPLAHEREEHTTPAGAIQPFTWASLRRS